MNLALSAAELWLAAVLIRRWPTVAAYMLVAVYSALTYNPHDLAHYAKVSLVSDALRFLMLAIALLRSTWRLSYERQAMAVSYALFVGLMTRAIVRSLPAIFAAAVIERAERIMFVAGAAIGFTMLRWATRVRLDYTAHLNWTSAYVWITVPGTLGFWLTSRRTWTLVNRATVWTLLIFTGAWAAYSTPWASIKLIYRTRKTMAAIRKSLNRWLLINLPPRITRRDLQVFHALLEARSTRPRAKDFSLDL